MATNLEDRNTRRHNFVFPFEVFCVAKELPNKKRVELYNAVLKYGSAGQITKCSENFKELYETAYALTDSKNKKKHDLSKESVEKLFEELDEDSAEDDIDGEFIHELDDYFQNQFEPPPAENLIALAFREEMLRHNQGKMPIESADEMSESDVFYLCNPDEFDGEE